MIERLSHYFNGKRFFNLRCCYLQSSLNCRNTAYIIMQLLTLPVGFLECSAGQGYILVFFPPRTVCSGARFSDWCACKIDCPCALCCYWMTCSTREGNLSGVRTQMMMSWIKCLVDPFWLILYNSLVMRQQLEKQGLEKASPWRER